MSEEFVMEAGVDERRLRFLALHLGDLQTIGWVPLMAFFAAAAVWRGMCAGAVLGWFGVALGATFGWAWLVSRHVRRVYGRTKLSATERVRRQRLNPYPGLMIMIYYPVNLIWKLPRQSVANAVLMAAIAVALLVGPVLDETNLRVRRVAYGVGAALVAVAVPPLVVRGGFGFFTVVGVVWMVLAVFDYGLLRHVGLREGVRDGSGVAAAG
jgi:hypothetical protein